MDTEQTPNIDGSQQENPVSPDVILQEEIDLTGGVPDGTVEKTDPSVPEHVRERIDFEEKIVYEYGPDGEVTGFHKEPVTPGE